MMTNNEVRRRPFDLLSIQVANECIKLIQEIIELEKSKIICQEKDVLSQYIEVFTKLKEGLNSIGYFYEIKYSNQPYEKAQGVRIACDMVALIDAICYLEEYYGGLYSKEKEILSKYSLKLRLLREDMRKIGYVFDIDKALAELQEEIGFKWVEVTTGEMLEL